VGGTFTDVVLMGPGGSIKVKKVSSTPGRYEEAIVEGVGEILREAGVSAGEVQEVCHSTTAATNAVLERKGAKAGLLTTRGFRDVLELRRLRVPTLYDLHYTPPEPLVPRYLRLEVEERVTAQGEVLTPLDEGSLRDALAVLLREGVESVAVCLLNSYINPVHERAIGDYIRQNHPNLFVSLSCDIVSGIREYERTSTAVANAYLMPIMNTYLNSLRKKLTGIGIKAPISVMQSSGGMMTSNMAGQAPVFSLESGPVAGVSGALHLSKKMGLPDLLCFDMGGTTTKAAVIEKGEPHKASEYEIGAPISRGSRLIKGGGYLLMVRAIDVAEVGAGGGSIISLDSAGSFHVGPRSAGAQPGPIAYDRGGVDPTTSDANALLGYLNPEYLLGGALKMNLEKAARIFEERIAKPLGLPLLEAAYGVHTVANAAMARAMRAVTTERGRDVRSFTMVAFGGSGPVHAAGLARLLGVRRVIVPASPGLFSSLGLLAANPEYEFVRGLMMRTSPVNGRSLEQSFKELEASAVGILQQEGYAPRDLAFSRYADLHYAGQVHELTVPVPSTGEMKDLEEVFGEEHLRTYGYRADKEAMEITNIRVMGRQTRSPASQTDLTAIGPSLYSGRVHRASRKAYFGRDVGLVEVPVVSRGSLTSGATKGPMIIEEYDTTIVAPPGCSARRDGAWNVILEWEE